MFDEDELDENTFDDNSDFDELEEEYDGDLMYVTLHINARLQPMMRFEIEDGLERLLDEAAIGEIDGGGTEMSELGEPLSCDIEIVLDETHEEFFDRLRDILDECEFPNGSYIVRNGRKTSVGKLDGMAIYLDGRNLPAEVYKECDVNYLIAELKKLLGREHSLMSWWIGPAETALYFYGRSFDTMTEKTRGFIEKYPLCQNCRVERIS